MTLVIEVDPHKQTHTAAARPSGYGELLAWAQTAGEGRLWALEDVRSVSAASSASWWRAGSESCASHRS